MIRTSGSALLACFVLAGAATTTVAAQGYRLLMFDDELCEWCARWDEEIGEVYPRTAEGRAAPLVRHDLDDGVPLDVSLREPVRWTPTFVLLEGATEVGRITGYPGEDHFWGLLEQALRARGAL